MIAYDDGIKGHEGQEVACCIFLKSVIEIHDVLGGYSLQCREQFHRLVEDSGNLRATDVCHGAVSASDDASVDDNDVIVAGYDIVRANICAAALPKEASIQDIDSINTSVVF